MLRDAAPRLAYVVADFHNPTGALADEDQRRRLVDAARSAGTVLVVDETMSELRLDPDLEMPRRVCAFDPGGQHGAHGRLGEQGVLGGHADRLGAGRARRDPLVWSPHAPTPTSARPSWNSSR